MGGTPAPTAERILEVLAAEPRLSSRLQRLGSARAGQWQVL
jgi:hypothetical protein